MPENKRSCVPDDKESTAINHLHLLNFLTIDEPSPAEGLGPAIAVRV